MVPDTHITNPCAEIKLKIETIIVSPWRRYLGENLPGLTSGEIVSLEVVQALKHKVLNCKDERGCLWGIQKRHLQHLTQAEIKMYQFLKQTK